VSFALTRAYVLETWLERPKRRPAPSFSGRAPTQRKIHALYLGAIWAALWVSAAGCGGSPAAPPVRNEEALVDVLEVIPDAVLEIRYATADNFVKEAVYPVARCLLRRSVAVRLRRVAERLADGGYRLKLWDCYRPFSVQKRLWALEPNEDFVIRPREENGRAVDGSKHNRGAAVDVTLIGADGHEVEMPTAHDDFSERARPGDASWSEAAKHNAAILDEAMRSQGFAQLPTEWWHYDAPGWEAYSLLDVSLADSAFGDDTR
jgi:D-alanyl-D-alanine dipeptidase